MDDSKATFIANGITPTGFVWPFAASSPTSRAAARGLYDFALGGAAGSTQPLHRYAVRRVPLTDTTTFATHQAQVDAAIANNEVLIFLSLDPPMLIGASTAV